MLAFQTKLTFEVRRSKEGVVRVTLVDFEVTQKGDHSRAGSERTLSSIST
jgi:hypothetical protein